MSSSVEKPGGAGEAERLADAGRFDQALALYRQLLAAEPLNVMLHQDYNGLLYRLGRQEDYLKSFDRAPPNRALYFAKARFLMHGGRYQDAQEVFAAILARDPGDKQAGVGQAVALSRLGRHQEAASLFEALAARHGGDANLCANAAAAALARGDAPRALEFCRQGLATQPHNQLCLALMGTSFRLQGDESDERLNGYDGLIGIFDLEAPRGFSSMADFNAELDQWLDRLHPQAREHIGQSLRGGSQTTEQVFGAGHELIDRLEARIGEAVARFIAGFKEDAGHPFVSRRRKNFAWAGSWSSRLKSKGFHANHIHPEGWISSCYYVAVPIAVTDEAKRAGWIKFGEPDFPSSLGARRVIQPAPGRLLLFPSYMWHGTLAFDGEDARRTTIAFDAVPV